MRSLQCVFYRLARASFEFTLKGIDRYACVCECMYMRKAIGGLGARVVATG